MKKGLLFLFFLASLSTLAQQPITIIQEDLPSASDTVRLSLTLPSAAVDFRTSGANQTWNFSNLTPASQEVTSFVTVNASGYASSYPATVANLASPVAIPAIIEENLGDIQLTNPHFFYLKNAGVFQETGLAGTVQTVLFPLPLAVPYQRPDVLYRLPLTFNQKDSSEAFFVVDYYALFQVYFAETRKRVNEVDGWGMLTTPFGTFNTLRMVSTLYISDTIRTSDIPGTRVQLPVAREYKWLGKNQKLPLLQINTSVVNNQETVTSITYRDIYRRLTPLAVSADQDMYATKVYPSPLPSGQDLHLLLPESGAQPTEITVLNPLGQLVFAQSFPAGASSGTRFSVPASALGSGKGMFLVRIKSGKSITVKKVVRQ